VFTSLKQFILNLGNIVDFFALKCKTNALKRRATFWTQKKKKTVYIAKPRHVDSKQQTDYFKGCKYCQTYIKKKKRVKIYSTGIILTGNRFKLV
jgi:hypothetical protein